MEIMDAEQKREKRLKTNEESLRELWDNIKMHQHPYYRGAKRRKEKWTEKIFKEILAKNFTNGMGTIHSNPGSTTSTI